MSQSESEFDVQQGLAELTPEGWVGICPICGKRTDSFPDYAYAKEAFDIHWKEEHPDA